MAGQYERKDHLYNKAKEEGFRSRAAYKLQELDQRHHILKPGFKIIDLGAWPGGWLQVAAQRVGETGKVVGIDLTAIEPLPNRNVTIITGDVRDEPNIEAAKAAAGGEFDVVLSDMSPKITGIREVDQAASVSCAELALWVAGSVLRREGTLVAKVFKGNDTELFVRRARTLFNKIVRAELDATRKTSSEFYLIGLGFKKEASS
jgi:23S rRNA (uridine2552-2'-O)-methyltransferase